MQEPLRNFEVVSLPDDNTPDSSGINITTLFETIPGNNLLLKLDPPKFTIVAATDSYALMTGKTRQQLVGKGMFEVFSSNPDDPTDTGEKDVVQSLHNVIASKQPHYLPTQRFDVPNAQNIYTERYWSAVNTPVLDDEGNLQCIIHTASDITHQVQAKQREEKIKLLEQAHNLFMQAPVAISILKGPDLVIELANEPIIEVWGKGGGITGKPLLEVLPEIKGLGFIELMREVMATGKAFNAYEMPVNLIRRGIDEKVYFNFIYQPYYEEDKSTSVGIIIFATDVTERVTIKNRLEEKERSLKESAEKFSKVLEVIPQMTWTNLPDGNVNFYNERWFNYTGLNFEQTKGTAWQKVIHPDDIAHTAKAYANALLTGNTFEIENRYRRADGVYRWHLTRALPIKNEQGAITLWVGTSTDIDDRKRAESILLESEHRYRTLIDEATVANALFIGRDLRIKYANDLMISYWGKDRSILGKPLSEAVPELRGQTFLDLLDNVYTTGETYEGIEESATLEVDGVLQQFYFNFTYKAQRNKDGEIYGIYEIAIDVTKQVQARKALEQSDQRFQNLIREVTVGIVVLSGKEMRVEVVNDAYGKLIDRSANDLIGKPLFSIIPEAEEHFGYLLDNVRTTGEPVYLYGEPYFVWVNGAKKEGFLNVIYQPYKETDGTIAGVVAVCQDVTEQVMLNKKIEASEQRVRSVVESAPFPIGVYVGKEMRIELANQAIIDVFGKGNDVIGKLYSEVLPELDNQHIFEQLDAVYTSGMPYHVKNQQIDIVVGGKLQAFYFNYSFTPVFDGNGKVYGVMNTAAEVTDLNIALQKLEESEENLRNMILHAPVAMCILKGSDYVVEVANDRMFEIWGKPGEMIINKSIFEGLPEVKEQGFKEILDQLYTTGETFKASELAVLLPRGNKIEPVFLNFVYEPLYRQGEIVAIMVVAIDVSPQVLARQKIEEVVAERTRELAETNVQLQQTNIELNQFAYIASHDLQEPLRKVRTFTQLLGSSIGEMSEKSKSFMERIDSSANRMQALIKDVLRFSSLSKESKVFEQVDLNLVVQNVLSDYELLIEQKGAKVVADVLPVIVAIPIQMSQLFTNLISNALKFAATERQPVITIKSRQLSAKEVQVYDELNKDKVYYQLEVKDNGIGFDEQHAEQIFIIFQRLHGKLEYQGTGIGLALCKKIITNHQGVIYASSTKGEGSSFIFILPAVH